MSRTVRSEYFTRNPRPRRKVDAIERAEFRAAIRDAYTRKGADL